MKIVRFRKTVAVALPSGATADQLSGPPAMVAARISIGGAPAARAGAARCWGFGGDGRLRLGSLATVGDDGPRAVVRVRTR
jgi:hypothetical protein